MKLGFEKWISDQHVGSGSTELFNEAFTCYRASAYRASLLFSFLGFLSVVRDRLLAASPPEGFPKEKWDQIIENVQNDEMWNNEVLSAIRQKNPRQIFNLSEDLLQQVQFWRNRRNDCAHWKSNIIEYSHVEALWLFIESNLSKFVVSGSKDSLINEISNFYDPSLTPAGAKVDPIVAKIQHAIDPKDIHDFLCAVDEFFQSKGVPFQGYYFKDALRFFDALLQNSKKETRDETIRYIEGNEKLLIDLLSFNPKWIHLFSHNEMLLRRLWYELLFSDAIENDFEVFCSLLRNELIPEAQIIEANTKIIPKLRGQVPDDECSSILVENGFMDAFYEYAFINRMIDQFSWANSNRNFVVKFLEDFQIDLVIAELLSDVFSKENHPYDLAGALNALFIANEEKKEELRQVILENDLRFPKYLPALSNNDAIPF